jgi:hypothetical protein
VGGGGGILMRFPVKYPELVSVFIEASTNLKSTFRDIEDVKKLKTIGAYTNVVLISFLSLSKKLFIS